MFEARSCLVLCCRRTSTKRKFYGIMRHSYSQLSGVRQCVKMKIFAAILFTFSVQFTSLISAQEFSFGRCGPFPTVKQFDPQRVRILKVLFWKLFLMSFFQYSGRWFEYSNYFAFFQLFGKCVTANYRVLPSNPLYGNNVEIEVINKAINSM